MEKYRIIVVIVLALGFCCGQAISSFMPQTSLGQKIPADAMNATLTSSSIKPENTTNIPSDAVSEQSVETPAEGMYNVTNNMTAAGQPLGESEETLSNVSETIGEVLTNRSQELSITSEYLESGYLDQLPTLPDPQSIPAFANQLLCSAASNPCVGTDQADNVTGDNGYNKMYGLQGEDLMSGGAGDDVMEGNEDHDEMYGEDGLDFMVGSGTDDYMNGGDDADYMFGVWANDIAIGEAGNDAINGGQGMDSVLGGSGDDVVQGGDGDDGGIDPPYTFGIVSGQEGNDYLSGGLGLDFVVGGPDNDTIFHNTSTDGSTPDGSTDKINCGPGNDVAWISRFGDGDTAIDCETVHTDHPPHPDSDHDGVPDNIDNCKDVKNPDQLDSDELGPNPEGKGDECDTDDDNDHRIDPADNCGYRFGSSLAFNPDQRDSNHNGHGDTCDLGP